ncbi:MAG: hypothetical protein AAF610_11705 [Pseudomonadota bacterium]
MRKILITAVTLTASQLANAWGDCDVERSLATELDLDGVAEIEIRAVAGDLTIRGARDGGPLLASGLACVPNKYADQLEDIGIDQVRDGARLTVVAVVPEARFNDSLIGTLDLSITLPDNLPLRVFDSSGPIDIRDVGPLTLRDSSGSVEIENVNGDVNIPRDSSGELRIRNAGHVRIEQDSSGALIIEDVLSVWIGKDSSGSIRARNVVGDVYVGKDSSGDIVAIDVGGNLEVLSDGSGDIVRRNVAGTVRIPRDKLD